MDVITNAQEARNVKYWIAVHEKMADDATIPLRYRAASRKQLRELEVLLEEWNAMHTQAKRIRLSLDRQFAQCIESG